VIAYDDFAKVDLRVGRVLESSSIPESTKLVKLAVDFNEESPRTIFTGLLAWYEPEYFVDKNFIFVANLEPRKMMGEESQGMLLAVNNEEKPLPVEAPVGSQPGTQLR
jgi:methionyl-tRNA synthetase